MPLNSLEAGEDAALASILGLIWFLHKFEVRPVALKDCSLAGQWMICFVFLEFSSNDSATTQSTGAMSGCCGSKTVGCKTWILDSQKVHCFNN